MKVSVVIPVYNERAFIEEVLLRVQASPIEKEIILIDDKSTDGTRGLLEDLDKAQSEGKREVAGAERQGSPVRSKISASFFRPRTAGKEPRCGAVSRRPRATSFWCRTPISNTTPRITENLLEPIFDGQADVVYGSRFLGGPQRVHYFWHYAGNKFLTLLSDVFTNLKLTDMETCYKVFRREVLQNIKLKSDRFGFEPEITAKIAKGNWRIYEVSISYAGRTYAEGKKITWSDGFSTLWCIIRFNLFD